MVVKSNNEIRQAAQAALAHNWTNIVLTILLAEVISVGVSYTGIGSLLVGLPISFGLSIMTLLFVRGQKDNLVETLFEKGFKPYGRILVTMLLISVFVMLWMLLFIVPGIIKSYSYKLAPYIAYENTDLSPREAIRLSQKMMAGYKMKFFLIDLGFFGLIVLSGIGLFIPMLWIMPYMECTYAVFYEEMKAAWAEKNSSATGNATVVD